MSHDSLMKHTSTLMVTLTWKISDIGPEAIQGLPLPPERVMAWWVLSIVGKLGAVFIDGKLTCDVYLSQLSDELGPLLMVYGIPVVSTRWCQISHHKCWTLLSSWRFVRAASCAIWERTFRISNLTRIKLLSLLFCRRTYGEGVSEKSHTVPELRTSIQAETGTVFTNTVPNSFVLQLCKVRDLWGRHMVLLLV